MKEIARQGGRKVKQKAKHGGRKVKQIVGQVGSR